MPAPHWLRVQLAGPRGILARPMARLLNRFNRADYLRALEALDADVGERVLELGFGGGVGVEALLERGVHVLAAEPSVELRARAHRRLGRALAEGRLEVFPWCAEDLPEVMVDRALSMNTVYFWRDLELGLANLRRVVKKRLVLGIAPAEHLREAGFADEGYRVEELDCYLERLTNAGFDASLVSPTHRASAALLVCEPA